MKTTKALYDLDPLDFANMTYIEVIDAKKEAADRVYKDACNEKFGLPHNKESYERSTELQEIIKEADKARDYLLMWREEVGLTASLEDLQEKAFELCLSAHKGQFRKDKITPYSVHPIAVANALDTKLEKIVALLHDVVEDTDVKIEYIVRIFGPLIAKYVSTMTHEEDQDYLTYIYDAAQCPVCREVKIADITHNISDGPSRKAIQKYSIALPILKDARK